MPDCGPRTAGQQIVVTIFQVLNKKQTTTNQKAPPQMTTSKDESLKQAALASTCAFGKAAAKQDDRTLKLADVLLAADPLPAEFDFDDNHREIPTPKYGNPPNNNCVIAGRAHQTLRFEIVEQGVLINITDEDVLQEFKKQNGGGDGDIEVLDSLKLWRTRGWEAAGQNLKIKAFSKIDQGNHEQIKRTIFIKLGVGLGFFLPDSAITQFQAGQPWEVTREKAGPHGHYVYVSGYTKDGPVCVTWGRKQQMSWAFVDKYCDEAYAIIDAVDTPEKKRNLDEKKIEEFLKTRAPVSTDADPLPPH
jgi:hypothetical protein